jgi:hypothetical protein
MHSLFVLIFFWSTFSIECNYGHLQKRQILTSSCTGTPCANGGRCVSVLSNLFACICQPGFTGPTCTLTSNVTAGPLNPICPNGLVCLNGE